MGGYLIIKWAVKHLKLAARQPTEEAGIDVPASLEREPAPVLHPVAMT